jgi:hypothetical protein
MPHHLCKICNAFGSQPNLINSINFDIFSGIKTLKEIGEYYSPFLPSGFSPISRLNITGHKHHTDVSILLRPLVIQRNDTSAADKDIYNQLYDSRKESTLDYIHMLDIMLRCRMEDCVSVEKVVRRASCHLDDSVEAFDLLKATSVPGDETLKAAAVKVRGAENRLFDLIERRQGLWNSMKGDVVNIASNIIEKEKLAVRIEIMESLQETFGHMLQALSGYIVKEAFLNDIKKGREVYNSILSIMNMIVAPALKPLDVSKAVTVKQKRLKE